MRFLPASTPAPSPASGKAPAATSDVVPPKRGPGRPRKSASAGNGEAKGETLTTSPAPTIDYTRPTTSTELLMDLQRRVIALEELSTRKLTAGEYAIAVKATTGLSVEALQKSGYTVESCPCDSRTCKGWRMVPAVHYRTIDEKSKKDTSSVRPEELKDLPPEESLDVVFQKMFDDGLLKKKGDATRIPPDGPITWTHRQQLAFAKGFELDDLLELEGKPRELQHRLIASLREIGYDIISAPEKEKA